jgi:hypothetical protein
MTRTGMLLAAGLLLVAQLGYAKKSHKAPKVKPDTGGTETQARDLVEELQRAGKNAAALSAKLRPTPADYAAVFEGDAAKKAAATYGPAWDKGEMVIESKPDQSEVKLFHATTDELQAGAGDTARFPGGYKQAASVLKKGLTIYGFKFVRPGEDVGVAYDGLVYVNHHWVIFPKPWRAVR